LLDSDERLLVTRVSPPIFGLQHCYRFRKRMQLNMGDLRLNTLFSTTFSIIFFFFFNFPSFYNLYFFFFNFFLFYFLLQPMLILTGLFWCHKFQLHFMSLMPQTKGTFIKIERLKWSHAISIEYDKSSWEQYHRDFFHTLSPTEFDPCLIRMTACW